MYSTESIGTQSRPNIVYVEGAGPSLRLAPEQARLLGLQPGQIIHGVVTQKADGNVLNFGNRGVLLPQGMGQDGQRMSLQMLMVGGQAVLRQIKEGGKDGSIALRDRPDVSGPLAKLQRLQSSAANTGHLSRLFTGGFLESLLGKASNEPALAQLNNHLLTSLRLDGASIQRAILQSGLFTEQQIKAGIPQSQLGIKAALMEIRRVLLARGADVSILGGAIDELTGLQLETLAHATQRSVSLHWTLIFADQNPVLITLTKEKASAEDQPDSPGQTTWQVDLTIPWKLVDGHMPKKKAVETLPAENQSAESQSVELSANVRYQDSGLAVRLWVPDAGVCQVAREGEPHLRKMLANAGVTLGSFVAFARAKQSNEASVSQASEGISIDV